MDKKFLIAFLISFFTSFFVTFSLISSSVFGYTNSTNYCLDANVSQHITVINSNTTTENVTCPFGCNSLTGDCNTNPYNDSSTTQFYFLFPIISFVFLYFALNLKKEDWPIHMLLVATALLFILFPLGILSNVLPSPVAWLYYLSVIVFFIVMFYYILKIITRSVQQMGAKA